MAENIDKYRNKRITLQLKLKTVDFIFDKIIFYDKKNYDVVFDISDYKKNSSYEREVLNLHEGLDYFVTFKVMDVGNLGDIIGELISFKVEILNRLPEGQP